MTQIMEHMNTPFKLKYKNSAFPFKDGVPRKNVSGAPVSDMYKEEQMQDELISAYESDPKKYAYLKDYIGHDYETRSTSKIFQEQRKKKIRDYQKSQLKLNK
jgi:hypothetical protein